MKNHKMKLNGKKCNNIGLNRHTFLLFAVLVLVFTATYTIQAQTYGNIWNKGNVTAAVTIRAVEYANGVYVASGDYGLMYRSTNGETWNTVNTGYGGTRFHHFSVTYGDGKFVSAGRDYLIITSDDNGLTWTTTNPGSTDVNDGDLYSVAYGNGVFVALGEYGEIFTSSDGYNWNKKIMSGANFRSLEFGQGKFISGTSSSNIYTSTNGVDWTSLNVGTTIRTIHYGNNLWVAGGVKILTSPNGINWTTRIDLAEYSIPYILYSSTSAPGTYMIGGQRGFILTSSDGIEWRTPTTNTYNFIFGMVYGDAKVVAVGNGGPRDPISQYLHSTHYSIAEGTPPPVLEPGGGGGTTDTLHVTTPNGGESLAAGSKYTIKWSSTGSVGNVKLWYSADGNYSKIVDSTSNDGAYDWVVPSTISSKCKIRVSESSDGTPYDESDSYFSIVVPDNSTLTLTDPNGGETLTVGSTYTLKWKTTGTVNKIKIWLSVNGSYTKIEDSITNTGSYDWRVPNQPSSKCVIRISDSSDGYPFDESNSNFTIVSAPTSTITLTSPNGGEVWAKGSTEDITWTTSGEVNSVRIAYSTDGGINWNNIISSTANDGSYAWTLPNIIANNCLVKVSNVSNLQVSDVSNNYFTIGGPAEIILDKNKFNYGFAKNGATTCTRSLFVLNGGGGTINWIASTDASWINLSKTSGSAGDSIIVSVDPSTLDAGSYSGKITIADDAVENSPQYVDVNLIVKNSNQDASPFGEFATPEDGVTGVSGSISVTGWVLDDICLESVKIYREVSGELSYIGDAIFVDGARPDVEQAYPDYPHYSRAGWGYMLLSNFLPDGQLILKAIATDINGKQVILGTKTITLDNANAVKPFGAIDAPEQGGYASGKKFRHTGWALTPQPNKIPVDGSTINLYIDGVYVSKVNYNLPRSDISLYFPDYNNTDGPGAYLDIDTTAYSNGIHTISWSVKDNNNNSDGIGSRYFTIQNSGGAQRTTSSSQSYQSLIPIDTLSGITVNKGFNADREENRFLPNEDGIVSLKVKELDRIELNLGGMILNGHQLVGNQKHSLPVGSHLDSINGVFYWQLGPAFLGVYEFEFDIVKDNGEVLKKRVQINITPANLKKS